MNCLKRLTYVVDKLANAAVPKINIPGLDRLQSLLFPDLTIGSEPLSRKKIDLTININLNNEVKE